jgi:FkbM family methyltransferase
MELKDILIKSGVNFKNDKIDIPERFKRIKLDIGLSISAPHSNLWLGVEDDLLVFGFEPNPKNINILYDKEYKNSLYSNKLDNKYIKNNMFIIPIALDNVNEPTTMKLYSTKKDTGCSSLHMPTQYLQDTVDDIFDVPVFSLKNFFDLLPLDRIQYIEYIKIDAQGSDLNIIKSLGQEYLKNNVVYITAEPETYQYNTFSNSVDNMKEYMRDNNFSFIKHENTSDPTFINNKYMDLKDSIFIYQNG